MTTNTQDVGHCKHCGFQWVIGDASVYSQKRPSVRDVTKPGSLKCPFCDSSQVTIDQEDN